MKECPYCRKLVCVCEGPAHVPSRLAALEQRVGKLLEAMIANATPMESGGITWDAYSARLTALRSPGGATSEVDGLRAQVAAAERSEDRLTREVLTARRERDEATKRAESYCLQLGEMQTQRDEALGVVRDLADWEASKRIISLDSVTKRARALVAGQPVSDPRDAEIERLRCSAKGWKADAERYAQNADYAHDRATALRAHAEKLDGLCERVLESTPHLLECRSAGAGLCDACRRRIELDSADLRARGEVPR